tara:strand:- start:25310 stop:25516 length:207 start_codon:yes stop_codon:yes gene_type:complete
MYILKRYDPQFGFVYVETGFKTKKSGKWWFVVTDEKVSAKVFSPSEAIDFLQSRPPFTYELERVWRKP